MNTYCKLTDGRIMIIYGENSTNETYDVYSRFGNRHPDECPQIVETVPWSDVLEIDTNINWISRLK